MPAYGVRIAGDDLVFSAAHFITIGGVFEPLHGHNFRVAVEVAGPLDENQCVVDFIALAGMLKTILGELDHAMLLPTGNPAVRVTARGEEVEVAVDGRRWVFPRAECRLLPVVNTTAELLAHYIAQRLAEAIERRAGRPPERLRVELEECPGWRAACELQGQE